MSSSKQYKSGYLILMGLFVGVVLVMLNCSGLVKLNIPDNAYIKPDSTWLVPYKNNLRHNAVYRDVAPPYQVLWKSGSRSVITDHPLAVDNYLIFTVKNGSLVFMDLENGQKIGDGHLAPGFLHSPLLSNNILYYASNLGDETVGAFNLSNLNTTWKRKLAHLNTSPLLWKEKLFVGGDNGIFYCLDKSTGEVMWQFDSGSSIYSTPALKNGNLYFSNIKGNSYCLDAQSGNKIWNSKLKGNIYAGPLIANNQLFIGSTSGILYSLELTTGNIVWELNTKSSIYGHAAYFDETIYVGNNGHKLIAVDTDNGSILWEFKTKGIVNSAPLVSPDFVYFGSWDKTFYVLLRYSGEVIYKKEFEKAIKSSPIIYKDRIILQVANEDLFCLGPKKIAEK